MLIFDILSIVVEVVLDDTLPVILPSGYGIEPFSKCFIFHGFSVRN